MPTAEWEHGRAKGLYQARHRLERVALRHEREATWYGQEANRHPMFSERRAELLRSQQEHLRFAAHTRAQMAAIHIDNLRQDNG